MSNRIGQGVTATAPNVRIDKIDETDEIDESTADALVPPPPVVTEAFGFTATDSTTRVKPNATVFGPVPAKTCVTGATDVVALAREILACKEPLFVLNTDDLQTEVVEELAKQVSSNPSSSREIRAAVATHPNLPIDMRELFPELVAPGSIQAAVTLGFKGVPMVDIPIGCWEPGITEKGRFMLLTQRNFTEADRIPAGVAVYGRDQRLFLCESLCLTDEDYEYLARWGDIEDAKLLFRNPRVVLDPDLLDSVKKSLTHRVRGLNKKPLPPGTDQEVIALAQRARQPINAAAQARAAAIEAVAESIFSAPNPSFLLGINALPKEVVDAVAKKVIKNKSAFYDHRATLSTHPALSRKLCIKLRTNTRLATLPQRDVFEALAQDLRPNKNSFTVFEPDVLVGASPEQIKLLLMERRFPDARQVDDAFFEALQPAEKDELARSQCLTPAQYKLLCPGLSEDGFSGLANNPHVACGPAYELIRDLLPSKFREQLDRQRAVGLALIASAAAAVVPYDQAEKDAKAEAIRRAREEANKNAIRKPSFLDVYLNKK